MIFDRQEIATQYLLGWFWIDFLSTMPVGLIFDNFVNADLLRGSKVVKLIRFFKLLRIVKISKVTFNVKNNDLTKTMYKFFKQNQG